MFVFHYISISLGPFESHIIIWWFKIIQFHPCKWVLFHNHLGMTSEQLKCFVECWDKKCGFLIWQLVRFRSTVIFASACLKLMINCYLILKQTSCRIFEHSKNFCKVKLCNDVLHVGIICRQWEHLHWYDSVSLCGK